VCAPIIYACTSTALNNSLTNTAVTIEQHFGDVTGGGDFQGGSLLLMNNNGTATWAGGAITATVGTTACTGGFPGGLAFWVKSASGGSGTSGISQAMRIDWSGRVGIGTSNPSQKLEVVGKSRATAGYISSSGSVSIASGATSTIIDMAALQVNGSLQVGIFVGGGGLIYLAEAIFISNWDNGQYIKALDIYDGANVTLNVSGSNIQITNNGFGTFTWYWSYLLQPFL
jgi:hypothetical protein